MHNHGIVHKDIAPDNIMILPDGSAKLIDFGASNEATKAADGIQLKVGYAPIEQYEENAICNRKTDIYAIGAVMYHLLTGIRPPDSRARPTLEEEKNGQVDPLVLPNNCKSVKSEIPDSLSAVILNSMQVEERFRPNSMQELVDELQDLIKEEDTPVVVEISTRKKNRKHIVAIGAIIFVLLSVSSAIAVVSYKKNQKESEIVETIKYDVPDIKGMTISKAKKEVNKLHFSYDNSKANAI